MKTGDRVELNWKYCSPPMGTIVGWRKGKALVEFDGGEFRYMVGGWNVAGLRLVKENT